MANKNSTYLQSLVSFIEDTKPFSRKLTEIVEEYRFVENMTVKLQERTFDLIKTKGAWMYPYFSGGISNPEPTLPAHQVLSPVFRGFNKNSVLSENRGAFSVATDQNTDLPLVPLAFDPKCFQGVGISDAFIQRNGILSRSEPLLEGHDFFQSHGAYVFSIKQTAVGGTYKPLFTARPNENLILDAKTGAQASALNLANPNSAVRKLKAIMDQIALQLVSYPNSAASTALAAIQSILAIPSLPSSYEALLNSLVNNNTPIITGFIGWIGADVSYPYTDLYVNQQLSRFSPDLYTNKFTDSNARENGALAYDNKEELGISVQAIEVSPNNVEYEEWILEVISPNSFAVRGSKSGIIGYANLGSTFTSSQISFDLVGSASLVSGETIVLTPRAKITIHKDAALETWNLIKVNPLAYSRPVYHSDRYGYVQDDSGVRGRITIKDSGFPNSVLEFKAVSNTTFEITNTALSGILGIATVDTLYDDENFTLTIVSGSAYAFEVGDKFFVEITNDPPEAEDLDLYFGYDFDSYDAKTLTYNNVNAGIANYLTTIDFGFDSRFVTYNLAEFNLVVNASAEKDRSWRLIAIPNISQPLQMQNSSPNTVNQIGTDDPTNPSALTQFDMPNDTLYGPESGNDPDTIPDLELWYADQFSLEYWDLDSSTWTQVSTVNVGDTFDGISTVGFSFTLVPAVKPFIGARLHSSQYGQPNEVLDGGDVISWTIRNNDPVIGDIQFVSSRVPRLIMHGDSYHHSPAGRYTLTWNTDTSYNIYGLVVEGDDAGTLLVNETVQITDGLSYRNDDVGVHYTIVQGKAGIKTGDSFTFETYETKPTYLVHGSVSGWMPEAQVGKWYFNGKIGFKIKSPTVEFYAGNTRLVGTNSWTLPGVGTAVLDRIRIDAFACTYTLKSYINGHWTLFRDWTVVADGTTEIREKYLWLTLPPAVAGSTYTIHVKADSHELALGHDLAIIRTTSARAPLVNDFVLIERTEADDVLMSIKTLNSSHGLVLADLGPTNTDVRFIDHTARSGVPLENTSPETAILSGWIPTLLTHFDNTNSRAEFSDPSKSVQIRSAATGETIGTFVSTGPTPAEPVIFRWNSDFHSKYLPLNAEAAIVTLGSGMDDRTNVNLTEGIQFLISSGSLDGDALFHEDLNVSIFEISSDDSIGYDSFPYDFELGNGDINDETGGGAYYDLGLGDPEAPTTGAIFSVQEQAEQAAATEVFEGLVIYETDSSTHGESLAFVYSSSLPPVPVSLPAVGSTYANFITPLKVAPPTSRLIVSFAQPLSALPSFYVWVDNQSFYVQANDVEELNNHMYRFSAPADALTGTELKIAVRIDGVTPPPPPGTQRTSEDSALRRMEDGTIRYQET